ncbi:type IV pilus modification PilV family protein [Coraliomargarita sp. W4R53]
MKSIQIEPSPILSKHRSGFSLIEVVLAIGIFLITVLALVGLLGPTLQSVDEVEKTDEVSSVVNTLNAFLQSSPDIAPNASKFDAIYEAVASGNYATIYVFRAFTDPSDANAIGLKIGFHDTEAVGVDAMVSADDITDAAGPIYRVILSASSVIPTPTGEPDKYRSEDRDATNRIYTLNSSLDDYEEGYFAMEARIFAEDPGPTFEYDSDIGELAETDPIFTYNTAVVR